MLIVHFIGLAMGLGTSFAFMFLGAAAGRLEPSKRMEFMLNTFTLTRMGHIGLGLLIISGGYLATPLWGSLGEQPLFVAKLLLVVVLGALIGISSAAARKAKGPDGDKHLTRLRTLGQMTMLTALAIVALAVINFK